MARIFLCEKGFKLSSSHACSKNSLSSYSKHRYCHSSCIRLVFFYAYPRTFTSLITPLLFFTLSRGGNSILAIFRRVAIYCNSSFIRKMFFLVNPRAFTIEPQKKENYKNQKTTESHINQRIQELENHKQRIENQRTRQPEPENHKPRKQQNKIKKNQRKTEPENQTTTTR